jgi:hypothetical protein
MVEIKHHSSNPIHLCSELIKIYIIKTWYERGKMETPNSQIYDMSLFLFDTGTSMKSGKQLI